MFVTGVVFLFAKKAPSGAELKRNPKFGRSIVYWLLFAKLYSILQKRANREEQDVVFNKDFGITRSDSIRTKAYDMRRNIKDPKRPH